MKKICKKIVLTLFAAITLLVIGACGRRDGELDIGFTEEQQDEMGFIRVDDEDGVVGYALQGLSGEIRVLADGFTVIDLRIYAELFQRLHPDVTIIVEEQPGVDDMAQHMAFTTRLMANPPDILAFHGEKVFEKMDMGAVFADLNPFLDGPRGINRVHYFDNIFRAAEVQGSLFHLPHHVHPDFSLLNRRLFEGIGVDVTQMATFTVDDEIYYYFRIAEAFPDELIFPTRQFSVLDILMRERLYDLQTGEVFVDTPEMRHRFEMAMQIPLYEEVEFTPTREMKPHRTTPLRYFTTESGQMRFTTYPEMLIVAQYIWFMLEDHPNMQLSPPVLMAYAGGEGIGFRSLINMAMLEASQYKNLAWEFMRFVIELEEYLGHIGHAKSSVSLPVNRARFDTQLRGLLYESHQTAWFFLGVEWYVDIAQDEHREQTVAKTMEHMRGMMETVNFERRTNRAIMRSLLYPDVWLLVSGQQDIPRALASMQNRLELYVHE